MRSRDDSPIALLVLVGAITVLVLFAGVVVLFATQHRVAQAAPDYRVVRVGGVEYEVMMGRPVDPRNRVDRAIVAGLPAADLRAGPGQTLFGTFISATNDSPGPRTTADKVELRDQAGHVYAPLPLPLTNPYAYSQRRLRPGTRIPALGSVADDNLAATGRLLLFRIPAEAYAAGQALELVIHDPSSPGATASLDI
jgi:hypothetical protein